MIFLAYIELLLFAICAFTVFYLLVYAIAATGNRTDKYSESRVKHRFAILIPTYQDDDYQTDEKLRIIIALRSADRKLPAAHAYADDIKWQSFFSSYNRIELFLHIFSPISEAEKNCNI